MKEASENMLTQNKDLFRRIFELSPLGIMLFDKKGTLIQVNSSICATLGYSAKELLSKNIKQIYSSLEEGEIEKNISAILTGESRKHEVTLLRKDGTACILRLSETMILLEGGKKGVLSVSEDITERTEAENRMLTLSHALQSIPECVTISDLNNRIIFVNKAFCKTYGYSQEELIGKKINILRSIKTKWKEGDKVLSDTALGKWKSELINVRKDGTEFPIELSTAFIENEHGKPIALISIAVDITEKEKVHRELIASKERAEESDKLKSAFLTNMSHELRTPLNAIIGLSSLLVDTNTDEETLSYMKIILNSGQHLLSLVEDILDITMIETGQIKIKFEEVKINSILNEVKDIINAEKLRENKSQIELILRTNPDAGDAHIMSDSRKLKQVLINLLKNSLKFTNEGFIEFGYSEVDGEDGKYLVFFVKDTGIGIDPKYQTVIFDTFRQIDYAHTREFGGIGIGLSIAKRIVEILGGKIWVESEPEKGSVFFFTIPFASEIGSLENIVSDNSRSVENSFSEKTVLIAEDEVSNYEFLRMFFKKMNVRLLWAKNGLEAVSLCESNPAINLVLMDIKMPIMNGFEATRNIKQIRPKLTVIAQTAYAMVNDKTEALKSGCDDYLTKPIQIKQLRSLVKKYL